MEPQQFEPILKACEAAVSHWGEDAQTRVAIEEYAEAIVALCHKLRNRAKEGEAAEEIADVLIMSFQMIFILGEYTVMGALNGKAERLRRTLYGDGYNGKLI